MSKIINKKVIFKIFCKTKKNFNKKILLINKKFKKYYKIKMYIKFLEKLLEIKNLNNNIKLKTIYLFL